MSINLNLNIIPTSNSSLSSKDQALDVIEITVNKVTIDTMKLIVSDNENRMNNYMIQSNLLNKGIFYANDYYYALKKKGEKPRLDFLIKKNSFYDGFASKDFFERVPSQGVSKIAPNQFRIKENKRPSECLEALIAGLTLVGCGEVREIAHWKAVEAVLGKEKFDFLFRKSGRTPFEISEHTRNSLISLLKINDDNPSLENIHSGDALHITGPNTYSIKHINGESVGFNVVCSQENPHKFLGLGLNKNGATLEEICLKLIEEYNKSPVEEEVFTKELSKSILNTCSSEFLEGTKFLQNEQINFSTFQERGGGILLQQHKLNSERLLVLANAEMNEAEKWLQVWNNE